ncbi:MAG: hypothetical protein KAW67_07135 [Candidatus Eisenbacteria sp.]|nr:hypothetical protein [Candidatus Eisenbacteria bacterium]
MKGEKHVPTMVVAVASCVAVAVLTQVVVLLTGYSGRDLVEVFPLSRFNGPRIVWSGVPYAVLFLALLWFSLRPRLTQTRAWLLGLGFIVLGNLAQGGLRRAFLLPLQLFQPGRLYMEAACRIDSWTEWLGSFTGLQSTLFRAPGTHPPFAVLLYRLLGTPGVVAIVFTLIASLSIPLVGRVLLTVGMDRKRAALGALLFALVPAVNIYCGVSLDGVILTTCSLCLLGLARLVYEDRWSWGAFAMTGVGLLLTNALTFGGLFLAGVMLALAFRKREVLRALLLVAVVSVVVVAVLRLAFGYDHIRAFLNASTLENPHGFELIGNTVHYAFTRLENVGNVLLLMPLTALALFLHRRPERIGGAAIAVLGAVFLTGAYRTGETARATLFIYPFLFLSFRDLNEATLRYLIAGAGIQTIIMQLIAGYGS